MQRMGAINGVILSRDQHYLVSVGQEKRLTFWEVNQTEPVHLQFIDKENDEAKAVDM